MATSSCWHAADTGVETHTNHLLNTLVQVSQAQDFSLAANPSYHAAGVFFWRGRLISCSSGIFRALMDVCLSVTLFAISIRDCATNSWSNHFEICTVRPGYPRDGPFRVKKGALRLELRVCEGFVLGDTRRSAFFFCFRR